MNITEDYCSFEVARLLKDKGFNDPFTHMFINKDNVKFDCSSSGVVPKETIACPTHQMAMKWLREVHKVLIVIDAYTANHWDGYIDTFEIDILKNASRIIVPNEIVHHPDYTEAVEAALKFTLENLI